MFHFLFYVVQRFVTNKYFQMKKQDYNENNTPIGKQKLCVSSKPTRPC